MFVVRLDRASEQPSFLIDHRMLDGPMVSCIDGSRAARPPPPLHGPTTGLIDATEIQPAKGASVKNGFRKQAHESTLLVMLIAVSLSVAEIEKID